MPSIIAYEFCVLFELFVVACVFIYIRCLFPPIFCLLNHANCVKIKCVTIVLLFSDKTYCQYFFTVIGQLSCDSCFFLAKIYTTILLCIEKICDNICLYTIRKERYVVWVDQRKMRSI